MDPAVHFFFGKKAMNQEELQVKIKDIVEPFVQSLGYQLWGIEVPSAPKGGVLRIYIDHQNGVTIDDCAQVSKQISHILDVELTFYSAYTLEISSPGVERPFFTFSQIQDYVGKKIDLKLKTPVLGSKKWQGILLKAEENELSMQTAKQVITVSWFLIEKAKLVFEM